MGAIRRDDASSSRAVTYAATPAPPDPSGDKDARARLTRHALHHHGPLTADELAAWLSVGRDDVRARLDAVAAAVSEVDRDGDEAYALTDDLAALEDPPPADSVRLLGPGDPLLDGRDRGTVIPDHDGHGEVWKAVASPGVVLARGKVVGTWRAKAKGKALAVTVTPLAGAWLPAVAKLQPEADALAAARGRGRGTVTKA